jgi:hypothetical protein
MGRHFGYLRSSSPALALQLKPTFVKQASMGRSPDRVTARLALAILLILGAGGHSLSVQAESSIVNAAGST